MNFSPVADSDYDGLFDNQLTFGPNSTTLNVSLHIIDDSIFEFTELFSALLTLSGGPIDLLAISPDVTNIEILDDEGRNIIMHHNNTFMSTSITIFPLSSVSVQCLSSGSILLHIFLMRMRALSIST